MQSAACNHFYSVVILLYVAGMGLEVEAMDDGSKMYATILQVACNVLFTLELFLRLFALGSGFFLGPGLLFNVMDLVFVVLFAVELAVMRDSRDALGNVTLLRMVRLIRMIRIMRVIRLVRLFQPLRVLIRSFVGTVKGLACALLLLLLIVYTFAIVFTQAAKDSQSHAGDGEPELGRYFGSLGRSILSLFQSSTSGIDWELVYEPLHGEHWLLGGLYLVYFTFITFAVLNIMIGIFCQSSIESVREDQEEVIHEQLANKSMYVRKLKELFMSLTGGIEDGFTLQTFEQNMSNERVQAYFLSLDMKITDAWKLFRLLVEDESSVINMDRFVEGCLQLKGPATTIDLKDLASEFHWFAKHVDRRMAALSESQAAVRASVAGHYHSTRHV